MATSDLEREGPASRRECAGAYRRRSIEVDCGHCQGRQDLADRECLVGVLRLLAVHPSAEHIELLGVWEVRYDADMVRTLVPLAKALQALDSLGSTHLDGRGCRQCSQSPANLTSRILSRFPARPVVDDAMATSEKPMGQECESCLGRTRAAISAAGREYGKFESSLTKRTFKIVGGGSDASDPPERSGAKGEGR